MSLSANEENRDQLRRDMLDIERRHSQTQDAVETYRSEVAELRRSLVDVAKEKDAVSQSNGQLRESLRSAEMERIRYNHRFEGRKTRRSGIKSCHSVCLVLQCETAE